MTEPTHVKIAYVLAEFPSATETFIANEIKGLQRCGAAVTVFALREGTGEDAVDCPVYYRQNNESVNMAGSMGGMWDLLTDACRLEYRSPTSLFHALINVPTAFDFARIMRRDGVQHVHAHFAFTPADLALMIGRMEGLSVSFSAHAWDIYCMGRALPPKLRRAELCITCTDAAREHVTSLAAEPDRRKVLRIYHGTDLKQWQFAPRPAASPVRILAVGRLMPKKGFETLLRACRRLRERTDFRCEIVGRGPLGQKLKTLAQDLGIAPSVTFTGALAHRFMPDAYRRSDILAVPSVQAPDGDRDGLPNVAVEAMACGLPVVGSRFAGIPEAVEHERTGLLVPPGDDAALADALHRMSTDAELRTLCAGRARQLVETKFNAARNAQQVYDAIRAVVERKTVPSTEC